MDLLLAIRDYFADNRLLANLIGIHIVLGVILAVSFVVRKVLLHGGDSLVRWTGLHWLDHVGKEANRRVRTMMFWTTVLTLIVSVAAGTVYHVAGRDLRSDVEQWYRHLTSGQLLAFGWLIGKLALLVCAVKFGIGLVRRGKVYLEKYTLNLLHLSEIGVNAAPAPEVDPNAPSAPAEDEKHFQEQTVRHW